MNHHSTVQKLLTAYALGELSQQDTLQVQAHLAECDPCRDQLAQMQAILNIADSMKTQIAPEKTHNFAAQNIQAVSGKIETEERKHINWRIIMKSNITKSAAAATVLVAAFVFLTQNQTQLAWAEVVERIKEFQPYSCTRTTYYGDVKRYSAKVMHLTLSQRREERDYGEIYVFDLRQCPIRTLIYNPKLKAARLTINYTMGPARDPDFLRMLARMKETDAQRLEVRQINGVAAQGFRTVDTYNDITIWADVKTGIPVRLEVIHLQHNRKIVFEDFEFGQMTDPLLFSTEPPEGYEIEEKIIGTPDGSGN